MNMNVRLIAFIFALITPIAGCNSALTDRGRHVQIRIGNHILSTYIPDRQSEMFYNSSVLTEVDLDNDIFHHKPFAVDVINKFWDFKSFFRVIGILRYSVRIVRISDTQGIDRADITAFIGFVNSRFESSGLACEEDISLKEVNGVNWYFCKFYSGKTNLSNREFVDKNLDYIYYSQLSEHYFVQMLFTFTGDENGLRWVARANSIMNNILESTSLMHID
ncbi:hypothetical protein L2750_00670 [Shewanella submarina]|uniref:Lipoprotein n=1 Tax=Shewanella submarina TaxID=2016376 RepID=A0ABV7GER3_9GAMM|nr:hypothetical protein [Shewanella submarina]MCL1035671.1 hypothetical protein [Shewanella submarina]